MKKVDVTKAELAKFDRMMTKRGFQKISDNRFYNCGTKVTVSVNYGIAVFSYRQELSEVKSIKEFIQANTKKRKVK
jgi:hypothetical protein